MDKQRIAAGLTLLVTGKDFHRRIRQIREIASDWQKTPLLFGSTLEPLNALIDVAVVKPEAFERLVELAAAKRRGVPVTKRIDYQRDLMRQKRERLYKALKLEELVRGAPINGDARKKYMHGVQVKWMAQRNAFVKSKGNLSWKARNAAANEFWQQLDAQLERDLVEAQAVLDKPPGHRKRVVQVAPEKTTALSLALKKAQTGSASKAPSKKVQVKPKSRR